MTHTRATGGSGYNVPVFSMEQIARFALAKRTPPGGWPNSANGNEAPASESRFAQSNVAFDEMYARRVRRARATPSIEKLQESLRSYEPAAARMQAGVRIRKPAADDAECLSTVRAQLATLRRLEDRPVYMLIARDGS